MNYQKRIIQIILAVIILGLPVYGCGMRSTIQVQVIDAETKQPIENAAVLVYWLKPSKLLFVIPWTGRDAVELKEMVSDKNGYFKMPKYSNASYEYYLTIYKKGYVCWSNREIFPRHEKRGDIVLKNRMVIELERFKEEYDKVDHAGFVSDYSIWISNLPNPSSFKEAIKEEKQFYFDWYRTQYEKRQNKRGE